MSAVAFEPDELDELGLDRLCARASAYANGLTWTRSTDIVIDIGRTPLAQSPDTPAWWDPRDRTIHVNVLAIVSDVDDAEDLLDRFCVGDSFHAAVLHGMLRHELAHSRWSTWDMVALAQRDVNLYRIAEIFEEIRIETRLRNINDEATPALRASFRWILEQMDAGSIDSRLSVGHAWCLVVGRHLSGIADFDEVEPVDELARSVLGDAAVDEMYDILGGAVSLRRNDMLDAMMPVYAQRWLDLLDPDGTERIPDGATILHAEGAPTHGANPSAEDGEGESGGSGEGDEGDGEGGGDSGSSASGDGSDSSGTDDGLQSGHGQTQARDISDLAKGALRQVEKNVENEKSSGEPKMADPGALAQEVFGARNDKSRFVHPKKPSRQLQQRARRMAQIFERMSLPSITLTTLPSDTPPGRLRSREMVRKSAEQAQGLMSTATPWERKKRRHSHTRPVIVGVMTDVSGSMRWAEEITASFSWMLATAGVRIGARTASVTFGEYAEAVVGPGDIPREVMVREANGGDEAFDQAAAALDGVLRFSVSNQAAKVLFIFSDGHLVRPGEMDRAKKRLEEFAQAGTLIIWVEPDERAWDQVKPSKNGAAIRVREDRHRDDMEAILQRVEDELLRSIQILLRA